MRSGMECSTRRARPRLPSPFRPHALRITLTHCGGRSAASSPCRLNRCKAPRLWFAFARARLA